MRLLDWCSIAAALLAATALLAPGAPTTAAPAANPFPSALPSPSESTPPQSNPFPSPSVTPQPAGGNGYLAAGYLDGRAGGGTIRPQPGSTATAAPFPSSASESGFWVDLLGRLGPSYLASLAYENYRIAGGDRPLVSYAQLRALYQLRSSPWALGLGFLNTQRSTTNSNANALGFGLAVLPSMQGGIAPYGSLFFYPGAKAAGSSSTFVAGQFGLTIAPRRGAGPFLRFGISAHCCFPQSTSPKSDAGLTLGVGTSF